MQTVFVILVIIIAAAQAFLTELGQIFLCGVAGRHIIFREFLHAEFDFHIAAFRNEFRILNGFRRVSKKLRHFLRRFQIILPAFVAHPVFVMHFLSGLDAQQDIVRLPVAVISIMHVVGGDQRDLVFLAHPKKLGVDGLLLRHAVILQL